MTDELLNDDDRYNLIGYRNIEDMKNYDKLLGKEIKSNTYKEAFEELHDNVKFDDHLRRRKKFFEKPPKEPNEVEKVHKRLDTVVMEHKNVVNEIDNKVREHRRKLKVYNFELELKPLAIGEKYRDNYYILPIPDITTISIYDIYFQFNFITKRRSWCERHPFILIRQYDIRPEGLEIVIPATSNVQPNTRLFIGVFIIQLTSKNVVPLSQSILSVVSSEQVIVDGTSMRNSDEKEEQEVAEETIKPNVVENVARGHRRQPSTFLSLDQEMLAKLTS